VQVGENVFLWDDFYPFFLWLAKDVLVLKRRSLFPHIGYVTQNKKFRQDGIVDNFL
jgi:hypothetical protein